MIQAPNDFMLGSYVEYEICPYVYCLVIVFTSQNTHMDPFNSLRSWNTTAIPLVFDSGVQRRLWLYKNPTINLEIRYQCKRRIWVYILDMKFGDVIHIMIMKYLSGRFVHSESYGAWFEYSASNWGIITYSWPESQFNWMRHNLNVKIAKIYWSYYRAGNVNYAREIASGGSRAAGVVS